VRLISSFGKWLLVFIFFFIIIKPPIANATWWIQTIGSDIRWDKVGAFEQPSFSIPAGNFISDKPAIGTWGIAFSMVTVLSHLNVGGGTDIYTENHVSVPTRFDLLKAAADAQGLTSDLTEGNNATSNCRPSLGNCTLQNLVPIDAAGGRVYVSPVGQDVNLNTFDFSTAPTQIGNYVFLINGNLTIRGDINVPVGSTVIFSVKGNIATGATTGTDITNIEGLYSTDGNFTLNTTGGCRSPLNVEGTVIVNAARNGGVFTNTGNRDRCTAGPIITFTERPDFLMNYPSFVKYTPKIWQEIAP
jgi:hypothetical protein